ncbi:MAG: hypothetical protein B6D56_05020 [Candidatus Omnitrophica bacterium 4484_70.1]|nr:MAG: hypothetical protein B6D56_05020 [Candidatus Omnitrophica bacterium 4484_70.1]
MAIINISPILREKLTDKGVEALIKLLNEVEEKAKDRTLETAESKFEARVTQLEIKFEKKLGEFRSSIEERLGEFRNSIEERLGEFKISLLKWIIGLFIGQTAIILSILAIFINLIVK